MGKKVGSVSSFQKLEEEILMHLFGEESIKSTVLIDQLIVEAKEELITLQYKPNLEEVLILIDDQSDEKIDNTIAIDNEEEEETNNFEDDYILTNLEEQEAEEFNKYFEQDYIDMKYENINNNNNVIIGGYHSKIKLNSKRIKKKYKQEKINPKRFIHHLKQKKQIEETNCKISNLSYYHAPTSYYEGQPRSSSNNYYNDNNRSKSREEQQLQKAIENSVRDNHMINFANECGLSYDILLSLTQRELTPEDYELLLQLDNSVQKKTTSSSTLNSLPTCTLHFNNHNLPNNLQEGDMCICCMNDFCEGEEIRWIPKCEHVFHKECIDQWLKTHSTTCPICRIDLS
ncbi:hypothetical protein ABK040_009903 [Willaertia magna]